MHLGTKDWNNTIVRKIINYVYLSSWTCRYVVSGHQPPQRDCNRGHQRHAQRGLPNLHRRFRNTIQSRTCVLLRILSVRSTDHAYPYIIASVSNKSMISPSLFARIIRMCCKRRASNYHSRRTKNRCNSYMSVEFEKRNRYDS